MGWDKVEAVLPYAKGIAWDGCHKIYMLMDDEQMQAMRDYGYAEGGSSLIPTDQFGGKITVPLNMLHGWFDESCPLKFIQSVRTVDGDPNDGYDSLITQFEFEEDEDEEDEDEDECNYWGHTESRIDSDDHYNYYMCDRCGAEWEEEN